MKARLLILLWALTPAPATAQGLDLPSGATRVIEEAEEAASLALPTAPAEGAAPPAQALTGSLSRQVWRIPGTRTTAQLMAPLRQQVEAAGWEILLDCGTEGCGGFDFRFGIDAVPPPEMFVNLGDFRFLSARRGDRGLTLLASRSETAGYLQILRLSPAEARPEPAAQAVVEAEAPAGIGAALEAAGHAVLSGIEFASGATALPTGDYPALEALAEWMADNPEARIALVGHTDATGALDGNIALSRARAAAVMQALEGLGVGAARMQAQGMGWLSPLASNAVPAGREANRRVEAVLLP
ncbi:OmpA family protein [Pseudoroseicyclus aestuarii]|uniref:OOP family OmpA-OmpF porin n=1 Tax=Pseudoroseicyclus aestuarii TaxID=1795041 RepID=A0A318STJ3_9RHOB|nr:OmpA family protein [Pseudoroseicyclus aestuarii]PYE83699.1 OOP family OmpA-OmpF porin [Pseudoroseicyclus aestuarii]